MALTDEQGAFLVRLARSAIDDFLSGSRTRKAKQSRTEEAGEDEQLRPQAFLSEERGAFVTLKRSDGELRGCIGFPYPDKKLGDAVAEAAISAAVDDPRFPPVEAKELDGLLVEVSALTRPETLVCRSRKELPSQVRIGIDGLMVSAPGASGLLLPQVATEYNMQADEFLSQTCMKAGLMPDAWLTHDVKVQRFQAEVFGETSPRGEVKRELG